MLIYKLKFQQKDFNKNKNICTGSLKLGILYSIVFEHINKTGFFFFGEGGGITHSAS